MLLVQGGKSFLNNQSSQKKTSKEDSSPANSFDDILKSSSPKQKKSISANEKSTPKKKEDYTNELSDGNASRVEDHRIARKIEGSEEKRSVTQTLPANNNSSEAGEVGEAGAIIQEPLSTINENRVKAEMTFADVSQENIKNLETVEKGSANHLSTNSSELAKETLAENQKKIENLKNSFDKMMVNNPVNKIMTTPLKDSNLAGLKLGSEFKIAEKQETLDVDLNEAINDIKITSLDNETSAQSETDLDMNSMLNQFMEQDLAVKASDNSAFAEELRQIESPEKSFKPENMNSIVKQARAFVDDGGGSMEIHLQPEGLGKVHLKVAVDNGQVNVEMLTDNLEARKALEEGLADIKTALEGQKLLVETLKVEMSKDYQKDFSDMGDHLQEQANRDFAEQFLDQFKQERDTRFSGMFDGFKSIQPNQKEPELTLNQRNPYQESGKGNKLNLVA